jgi:hypothetical protein
MGWCGVVQGERRRYRQVLVIAVGSALAKVQSAGPGRAAQGQRPRRDPQSRQTLGLIHRQNFNLSMVSYLHTLFLCVVPVMHSCMSVNRYASNVIC